ncbi:hypothetical protein HGRIS_000399 [Hohenbuehelia grisea]|uniref:Uncharacterized protein n=1 Tax=Hohenbuehelia grisea TaxID=104357 RepID=A0ABR3JR32_9AGAR
MDSQRQSPAPLEDFQIDDGISDNAIKSPAAKTSMFEGSKNFSIINSVFNDVGNDINQTNYVPDHLDNSFDNYARHSSSSRLKIIKKSGIPWKL